MFKVHLWYDNENLEENVVDNIGIRCSNCGKKTGLSVKNKKCKDILTRFLLITVLHHVSLSWIIETN